MAAAMHKWPDEPLSMFCWVFMFQKMIMQYLNDGWQLAGGVAVKSNPGVSYDEYFQALIGRLPDDIQKAYISYGEDFQAGYTALNQGEFDRAVSRLSEAMEQNPDPHSFIGLELLSKVTSIRKLQKQE